MSPSRQDDRPAEVPDLRDPEVLRALSARLGTDPAATLRLIAVGVPLLLVALARRGSTSTEADLLLACLEDGTRIPSADDRTPPQVEALVAYLLGSGRAATEGRLQRLAGLDAASVHGFLCDATLRLLTSLARMPGTPDRDARTLCRQLGAALARGEDAVPGSIGAFEELLDTGVPVEEDLVRIGLDLLGSLGGPARSRPTG